MAFFRAFSAVLISVSAFAAATSAAHAAKPLADDEDGKATSSPGTHHTEDEDEDDGDGPVATGEIVIVARRLDAARETIDPALGASSYILTNDAVEGRPGGETVTLGQILLQAPGVSLAGNGQLRVRAQGDLQYRINNIIVPEGLNDLADSLSSRLIDGVQLVVGTLPAQYGFHAGGVINITTKSGVFDRGGQAEIYGGSQGEFEPAFEYGANFDDTNLFVSGSYRRNHVGLLAPSANPGPINDTTDQFEGFGYLDRIVDSQTRISLITGVSRERFELPLQPGDPTHFGSQTQDSDYALASLLRTTDAVTLQASAFFRYSRLVSHADRIANGVTGDIDTAGYNTGLQFESVYSVNPQHTLRAGAVFTFASERTQAAIVGAGTEASARRTAATVFVQDEWRPISGVVINGGLRFDHASGAGGGDRLSPRLNLLWSGGSGFVFHGGYARYFVPAPQGSAASPDGNLLAETDDYFDVGAQRTRGGLTLGIEGYLRRTHNLLATVPQGLGLRSQSFNFAKGRSTGAEFTMTYSEGPVSAWANLAVARNEGRDITTGRSLFSVSSLAAYENRFVPLDENQTVTVSGGVTYRLGQVRLSGDLIYGSGLRRTAAGGNVNAGSLPAYAQVNLAGVVRLHRLGGRPLDLRIDLNNVFDNRYQLRDGTASSGGAKQYARGRGVFVGFEQAF